MKTKQPELIVRIQIGGEAFGSYPCEELARVLRGLADKLDTCDSVDNMEQFRPLYDRNGNVTGYYAVKPAGYVG